MKLFKNEKVAVEAFLTWFLTGYFIPISLLILLFSTQISDQNGVPKILNQNPWTDNTQNL